ncbi:putative NPP1 domain protein [Calycina marina]|uniref:NPP1 domain protein n=1 Tax=Calycina marina TaxID=1763456 RepID=A0A9P7Z7H3_9HELO|nr:putative NPP1 domain protein [Calycina marina]
MVFFPRISQLLVAASTVNASPMSSIFRRGTVPNSEIVGLPETVQAGIEGQLYEAYQPFLDVYNGCVPFPAVDVNGNTNAGLGLTGGENEGCSSSLGQIYARAMASNGRYAIMYSWYMPKDEPSPLLGHRHEWEGVIVWLANGTSTTASNILAVCPSAHGDWNCSTHYFLSGTGPLIAYVSFWPVNHQMILTTAVGGQQPLIAWESLSEIEQNALQTTDFGSATVPFKDSTFAGNIAAATF